MKTLFTIPFYLSFLINSIAQESASYAWLTGNWEGDGFGGTSEELWSQPDGNGTMMGVYRHYKDDGSINFYEFMVMDSTGLKLKHFNPDMLGWETKEDFVHFKAIEFTENKIVLKGLIFERKSDKEMEIHLSMKEGNRKWTEVFKMRRK